MAYRCKLCGSKAEVSNLGVITRSCKCDCGVIADMQAVAYGDGGASVPSSRARAFIDALKALLKARPA